MSITNYVVSDSVSGGLWQTLSVECNVGDVATGGGVSSNSQVPAGVSKSQPTLDGSTPIGWTGTAIAPFTVYAVCQSAVAVPAP